MKSDRIPLLVIVFQFPVADPLAGDLSKVLPSAEGISASCVLDVQQILL